MLRRDGHPTALREAIASYSRIPKTLHICTVATEEPCRRDIKAMRNLQEGRHVLATGRSVDAEAPCRQAVTLRRQRQTRRPAATVSR